MSMKQIDFEALSGIRVICMECEDLPCDKSKCTIWNSLPDVNHIPDVGKKIDNNN